MTAPVVGNTVRKQQWPKISQTRHKNGAKAWLVDSRIMRGGKVTGERLFFKTKAEADTKAAQLRAARTNEGVSSVIMPSVLRAEAEAAIAILAPHGVTLKEAAEFFAKHHKVATRDMTVDELLGELLKNKTRDGASPRYTKDLRTRLAIFAASFPATSISDLSTATIVDWLRDLPHSPTTRNNYRRLLGVLFSFAHQRGYILANPVPRTSRAKVVDNPPGILTPSQCASLLENAESEFDQQSLLAYLPG